MVSVIRCCRCKLAPHPNTGLVNRWRYFVCRSFIRDEYAQAWVLNHTSNWFSIGFTTSPITSGHLLGLWVSDNAQKRQPQSDGKQHKQFRGLLIQAAGWWFKFYVYVYFDGDGTK